MAKIYIFLAEGHEEIEALTVVDLLRRANIDITMVSITGKRMVTGSHQITTQADALFEEINCTDADMLILPGGMPGTKNLQNHAGLDSLLKDAHAKKIPLAAICAAPIVLGTKGLLEGKNAVCYPGHENNMGGAQIVNEAVVTDGNIITAKGMGAAIDFSLAIIKFFSGADKAKEIAAAIQYPFYTD
ncbi:DJ-1/PfpI family protein [Lachnospiraceae bacterium MD1]|jgi:4-methyl-5(b-hydroxyethyl)-thiazole monophosphate biosynthesis|uniref:DJ-1/PfpI family protein n=1 Tax=Variimorphobacter saccharofermentans TaxID=2755051 RepID=A0A839JW35_9FIRM|nr:DJ-1 family glyoxalase III [Variimorphobacter saccharofermentans]MBB2181606.1 DJ-1/PfpI family protein [Variimorphobacter saccharofermentans]